MIFPGAVIGWILTEMRQRSTDQFFANLYSSLSQKIFVIVLGGHFW
jgi:hypothetical protein